MLHKIAVLERPRLTLIGITNKITGLVGLPVQETPFQTGRKTCSSPAAKSRFDDFLLNLCRGHLTKSFVDRSVAAMLPVNTEVPDTRYIHFI